MPQTLAYPEVVAEVGALFGLSRPAGQCFAVIWRAAQPPCADDLSAALGLSRSNVSTALKELREWGLIGRARAPGDRKDYFVAPSDPWEIARLVLTARQHRAMAPLLDRLLATGVKTGDARLEALHSTLAALSTRMEGWAALSAEDLAALFLTDRNEEPAEGKSAGKKKKKKKR